MLRGRATLTVVLTLAATPALAAPGDTTLVGREADGRPSGSTAFALSGDGRFVVMNGSPKAFVRDTVTGATTAVGGPARDWTTGAAISGDGRIVAIQSTYHNHNDTSGERPEKTVGIYAGEPGRVEPIYDRYEPRDPDISADGRYVSWVTDEDAGGGGRVYVHDRSQRKTFEVSHADGKTVNDRVCFYGRLSASGRFVVYMCTDVADGRRLETGGIYVRDLVAQTTTHACRQDAATSCGEWAPGVSDDGRIVTWSGQAGVLVRDLATGRTDQLAPSGSYSDVSDDGRYVIHADRWGGIFVFDRTTGAVEIPNRADGADGRIAPADVHRGGITGNGRYVLFQAQDDTLDAQAPAPNDESTRAYVRELVGGAPPPAPAVAAPGPAAAAPPVPAALPRRATSKTTTRRDGLALRVTRDARLRSRGLRVTVTNSRRRAVRGSIVVRAGGRTIGRRTFRLAALRSVTLRVRLRRVPARATVSLRVGRTELMRTARLR
jgi:Tol biopolymer transport system component